MEFTFIVGRYSLTNGTEKAIAGFLKLETAKDYIMHVECDYLSNGYFYIDTAVGRHILGADRKTEKEKWYGPEEKVYVYDTSKDYVISLEEI
jgi:hypothetical protein